METNLPQIECIECKQPKPLSEFRKFAIKENRQLFCRQCRRLLTYRKHNVNTKSYRDAYYKREDVKERRRINDKNYRLKLKDDPIRRRKILDKIKESRKLHRDKHPLKRLARRLKNRDDTSIVTPQNLWKILKHQKCKCALTGRKLTASNISPDHIVCLSNGGKTEPLNIRLVTKEVNNARGLLSDSHFIALCLDVVNHSKVTLTQ